MQKKLTNSYKIYNKYSFIGTLLSEILIACAFIQLSFESLRRPLMIPMLVLGIVLYLCIIQYHRCSAATIYLVGLIGTFACINYFFVGNQNLFSYVKIFVVFLPIALFLISSKTLPGPLWIPFVLILWVFIIITWLNSPDGYALFENTSRNYVSIYSLFFIFLLAVVFNSADKQLPVYFCFLCYFASVIAIGRGGIIASSALIVLVVVARINASGGNRSLKVLIIAFAFIILLLTVDIDTYEKLINAMFSRFVDGSAKGSNNERMQIYSSYIREATKDLRNIMIGVNTNSINSLISEKNGNVHNSFLQYHANYGIIPLAIMLICLINSGTFMIKNRKTDQLIILVVILLRCSTDFFFPGELGDIVIWYYVLLPFESTEASLSRLSSKKTVSGRQTIINIG